MMGGHPKMMSRGSNRQAIVNKSMQINDDKKSSSGSQRSDIENMSVDELRKIVESEKDNNQKILAESSKIFK